MSLSLPKPDVPLDPAVAPPRGAGREAAQLLAAEGGLSLSGPETLGIVNRVTAAAAAKYVDLLKENNTTDARALAEKVNEVLRLDGRSGTFEDRVSRVYKTVVHPQAAPPGQPPAIAAPSPLLGAAGNGPANFSRAFQREPASQPASAPGPSAQPQPAPTQAAQPAPVAAPPAAQPFGTVVHLGDTTGWINPAGPLGRSYNPTAVTGLTVESFSGPAADKPSPTPLWMNGVTVKEGQTYVRGTAGWGFSGIDPNAADPFIRGGGAGSVVAATKINGTNLTGRFGFKLNPENNLSELSAAGRADADLPFAQGFRARGGVFVKDEQILGMAQVFANEWNFGGLKIPGGDLRIAASNVVPAPGADPVPGTLNFSAEGRVGQRLPDPGLPLAYTTKIPTPFIAGVGFSQTYTSAFSHTDSLTARVGYGWRNGSFLTLTGTIDNKFAKGVAPAQSYSAALGGFIRLAGDADSLPPSGTDGAYSGVTPSMFSGVKSGFGVIPSFRWSQSPGKEGVFDAQIQAVNWWQEAPSGLFSGPGSVVVKAGFNSGTEAFNADIGVSQRIINVGPTNKFDIYARLGAGVKVDPSGTSGFIEAGPGIFLDRDGNIALEGLGRHTFGAPNGASGPNNQFMIRTTLRFR